MYIPSILMLISKIDNVINLTCFTNMQKKKKKKQKEKGSVGRIFFIVHLFFLCWKQVKMLTGQNVNRQQTSSFVPEKDR